MRRQIIDYYGTRCSDGTRSLSPRKSLSVHETTNYRLLWYSICGQDKFPIFIHKTTIDRLLQYPVVKWNNFPISKKDLVVHRTTTRRLPQYLTYEEPESPSTKTELSSKAEKSRLLQYSNNLSISYKGTTRPRDDKPIDYYGTRRNNSRQPMTSFMKRQSANRPSTKRKKYYTSECKKVLQQTHIHSKAKRILQ